MDYFLTDKKKPTQNIFEDSMKYEEKLLIIIISIVYIM